jgi:tRNA 2-selenouridine synthase
MALRFASLRDFLNHGFDTVIDVRSPAEFAEDHVPGAINLPVLDNDERAEVGTIYVQNSTFLARKIGAVKVFRNAADHIETQLAHHDGSWRPLVYCWRGGQRSGAFTWMLEQIGWRADVVEGGYQSYRRQVFRYLYKDPLPFRLMALDGYTGTAKTDLLKRARDLGAQVLDLEGLAAHRGSLLGGMGVPQPSQKQFESRIASDLCRFDPAHPVLVEAESSKIGDRIIPPTLWTAMKAAPRIEISAPLAARCTYLQGAYDDILSDAVTLRQKLDPLRTHRGHALVDQWFDLIDSGDKAGVTRALMEQHYDRSYDTSRKVIAATSAAQIELTDLSAASLDQGARRIVDLLAAFQRPDPRPA